MMSEYKNIIQFYDYTTFENMRKFSKSFIIKNYKYVDLSIKSKQFFANTAPLLFCLKFNPPVVLYNIHCAPEILPVIKEYALHKGKTGDFILVANKALELKISNIFRDIGDKYIIISSYN